MQQKFRQAASGEGWRVDAHDGNMDLEGPCGMTLFYLCPGAGEGTLSYW
jgi:hypothetical protein